MWRIFAIFLVLILNFAILPTNATTFSKVNFVNCKNIGWKCINNIPNDVVYSCNTTNKANINIYLKDFYLNSVTSLTIQKCNIVKLHMDCPNVRANSNLQSIRIDECSTVEFSPTEGCSSSQAPANTILSNIGYMSTIPYRAFKNPLTEIEKKCFGNGGNIKTLLINNVTIGRIDFKAFDSLNGLTIFTINNSVIETIESNAINVNVQEFMLLNSVIRKIHSYAFNIIASSILICDNVINDLPPNSFNFSAPKVILFGNNINMINSEALMIRSNKINILNNKFNILKTGSFIGVNPMATEEPFRYNFTQNEIRKLEIGSLYFNSSSLSKINNEFIYMGNNRFDCKCNRLAWLVDYPYIGDDYNSAMRLNSHILDFKYNNTCLFTTCHLPLDIVKILLNNNMCHLSLDPQLMCYSYYDRIINNISSAEVFMQHAYGFRGIKEDLDEAELSDDAASNNTEPAPAFYIIKPEYFNAKNGSAKTTVSGKLSNNSTNEVNTNVDEYTVDLVTYLRSHNVPNDTVGKILTANRKKHPNAQRKGNDESGTNAKIHPWCHDKESCSKYIQENKKKALDFYKNFYAQLRPKNFSNMRFK
ncbi:uncharacterized protein LOC143910906 [Arctopsyche grandis]|uniref:uncharacterized protein LOC143910906 n=1 Tax=Arctopsyche grandis TaxID=121162 RepID=UPI00406D8089